MKTKISIITAVYNGAATIERTIKSVLSQEYAPYEYIVVDGCSTDNTLEIVNKYESDFSDKGISLVVISEKDNGLYDAMNKGIRMATGEVIGMINSDDWYENNALSVVADAYEKEGFDLFYADLRMHLENDSSFVKHSKNRKYATSRDWNHPTTFITKEIYNKYQYRNETLHDDYELILRLKKAGCKTVVVNEVIANFTMNGMSHTRSIKNAWKRCMIKYRIYRETGYSPLYFVECFMVEVAKTIIG